MKLLLAFVFLAVTLFSAPVQWTAASGGNDHWYDLSTESVNWLDARESALSSTFMGMQGYLAVITSAPEQAFIVNTVLNGSAAWLGASDLMNEGTWRWADGPEAGQTFWDQGTTILYSNWGSGEPNDYGSGEDFLILFGDGRWNDYSGVPTRYLVEYGPSTVVPEPSTSLLLIAGVGALAFMRRSRR